MDKLTAKVLSLYADQDNLYLAEIHVNTRHSKAALTLDKIATKQVTTTIVQCVVRKIRRLRVPRV